MTEITFNTDLFSTEKPPMYDVCHKYFGANWDNGTIFAYKNKIHAKDPFSVTPDVITHEEIHFRQQANYYGGSDAWWKEYLQNAEFRCSQEIEAYKAQIAYALEHYDRNYRRALKQHIYASFAGLSAGTITMAKAQELLG